MKRLILLTVVLLGCGESPKQVSTLPLDELLTHKNEQNIDQIYNAVSETLDSDFDLDGAESFVSGRPRWGLAGLKTSLGLGLKGEIGSLSWGGTKMTELIWTRKAPARAVALHEKEEEEELSDLSYNEFSTFADVEKQVDPIVNTLVKTKRVKDPKKLRANLIELNKNFLAFSRVLAQNSRSNWEAYKLRLDVSVGLSGSVSTGIFVKVGFDTRLRLQWSKSAASAFFVQNRPLPADPVQKRAQELIEAMASDISHAVEKENGIKKFEARVFRIGMGLGIKGNLNGNSAKAETVPYVYFRKKPAHLLSSLQSNYIGNIETISTVAEGRTLKIKRRKMRKALRKAFKFGRKMSSKLNRKKYRNRKWEVNKMKVGYKFSISGDVNAVNVKATPSFEIEYQKL